MMSKLSMCCCLVALAVLVAPVGLAAQETQAAAQEADGTLLRIELNKVQQSQNGCRLSFMAVNQLGTGLEKTALEIVVFDAEGIVSQTLVLDFGRLPDDKTKVVEFDLPTRCDEISRVLVNDVSECAGPSQEDLAEACLNALRISNRAAIEFGI